jgi:hypothetical protein
MACAPFQAPVSQLLDACAAELADLASRCEVLQSTLSPGLSHAAIDDAQALDLVTQSLAALSQFLGSIAAGLPEGWTVDPTASAASLPLASLGDRLIARESIVETSGELCLFEDAP